MYVTRAPMLACAGHVVAPPPKAAAACFLPGPVTLTPGIRRRLAATLATHLERAGFLLGWRSACLRSRRWRQVALMGDFPRDRVEAMSDALGGVRWPARETSREANHHASGVRRVVRRDTDVASE